MKTRRKHKRSSFEICGVSVRGPSHAQKNLPNQDSWLQANVSSRRVLAVSDGMGTRKHAEIGSRQACLAVIDAARIWLRYPDAESDVLLRLIHVIWRARIAPHVLEDCACTCLFTVINHDGSGVAGQLGDGLIAVADPREISSVARRSDSNFTNETIGLGAGATLRDWSVMKIPSGTEIFLMCTDGISEDLIPEKLSEFIVWQTKSVFEKQKSERRDYLYRSLKKWPTPKHTDDKTLAIVYRGKYNGRSFATKYQRV